MSTNRPSYPPPPPPQGPPPPQQQWQPVPPPQQQWQQPVPAPPQQQWPQGVTAPEAKPSAYWPLTIIATFMSLIIGGIGLFFSYQVDQRWNRGDVMGARSASQTAKFIGIAGIALGALFLIAALAG